MNYDEIKLNDVEKALRKVGFRYVKYTQLAWDAPEPFPADNERGVFYRCAGSLWIQCKKVVFVISGKDSVKQGFEKYLTNATDANGVESVDLTNCPQFFFPRLFGFINGEISEAEIIAEICA